MHSAAHRREIDNERNSGEVLQNNARNDEWNLLVRGRFRVPFRKRFNILRRTFFPSQLRSTDSRTMRMLTGNREILPSPFSSKAGKE